MIAITDMTGWLCWRTGDNEPVPAPFYATKQSKAVGG